MTIPFTQYLRPDWRAKHCGILREPDIEQLAQELISQGCKFEAEILTTGEVSLTCEIRICAHCAKTVTLPESWDVLAIAIEPNGAGIPNAVDRLVKEARGKLTARKAVTQ